MSLFLCPRWRNEIDWLIDWLIYASGVHILTSYASGVLIQHRAPQVYLFDNVRLRCTFSTSYASGVHVQHRTPQVHISIIVCLRCTYSTSCASSVLILHRTPQVYILHRTHQLYILYRTPQMYIWILHRMPQINTYILLLRQGVQTRAENVFFK